MLVWDEKSSRTREEIMLLENRGKIEGILEEGISLSRGPRGF